MFSRIFSKKNALLMGGWKEIMLKKNRSFFWGLKLGWPPAGNLNGKVGRHSGGFSSRSCTLQTSHGSGRTKLHQWWAQFYSEGGRKPAMTSLHHNTWLRSTKPLFSLNLSLPDPSTWDLEFSTLSCLEKFEDFPAKSHLFFSHLWFSSLDGQ